MVILLESVDNAAKRGYSEEAVVRLRERLRTESNESASTHPKYCPVWTAAAISPDLAYNNPKGQSDDATHMQRAPRV